MKRVGRHTKEYVEKNNEKTFTYLDETAILSSMECLTEAFRVAKKKKDSGTLMELSDKWLDIYNAIVMSDKQEKYVPLGFTSSIGEINE